MKFLRSFYTSVTKVIKIVVSDISNQVCERGGGNIKAIGLCMRTDRTKKVWNT